MLILFLSGETVWFVFFFQFLSFLWYVNNKGAGFLSIRLQGAVRPLDVHSLLWLVNVHSQFWMHISFAKKLLLMNIYQRFNTYYRFPSSIAILNVGILVDMCVQVILLIGSPHWLIKRLVKPSSVLVRALDISTHLLTCSMLSELNSVQRMKSMDL